MLRADGGSAVLLGGDPWRDAVSLHRRLAYVPGDVDLWPNLTGGEAIDVLGRLRGGLDQGRRAELLERFELDPSKKARAYSKGNRQKVALVAALAADVELLILDEPTSGLDPLMEAAFQDEIRAAATPVARCCSRATSWPRSKRCATVSASSGPVATSTAGRSTSCATSPGRRSRSRRSTSRRGWATSPGSTACGSAGAGPRSTSTPPASAAVVERLGPLGVRSLESHPPTLEELFLRHYGDASEETPRPGAVRSTDR